MLLAREPPLQAGNCLFLLHASNINKPEECFPSYKVKPSLMAHTFNSSVQEAEGRQVSVSSMSAWPTPGSRSIRATMRGLVSTVSKRVLSHTIHMSLACPLNSIQSSACRSSIKMWSLSYSGLLFMMPYHCRTPHRKL